MTTTTATTTGVTTRPSPSPALSACSDRTSGLVLTHSLAHSLSLTHTLHYYYACLRTIYPPSHFPLWTHRPSAPTRSSGAQANPNPNPNPNQTAAVPDWKKPQVKPAPTPVKAAAPAPAPAPKPLGVVGGGASQFGGSVYRRGSAPTHGGGGGGGAGATAADTPRYGSGGGGGGGGAGADWSPAKVAQLISTMDDVDWGKVCTPPPLRHTYVPHLCATTLPSHSAPRHVPSAPSAPPAPSAPAARRGAPGG